MASNRRIATDMPTEKNNVHGVDMVRAPRPWALANS